MVLAGSKCRKVYSNVKKIGNSKKCKALGGNCENINTECKDGFIVRNYCPEHPSNIGCCIPFDENDKDKRIKKHLEKVEGYMHLCGYIPSKKSGVTIATGYDLGHGPDISKCLNDKTNAKLERYKGHKTKAEVAKAGLKAEDLKVCLKHAKEIDSCLLDHNKKQIAKCVKTDPKGEITSVSDCGLAVLLSLNHWCGTAGLCKGVGRKCNTKKQSSPNLKEFCTTKGSDMDLQRALENIYNEHRREGVVNNGVIGRIKKELDFLKKCLEK